MRASIVAVVLGLVLGACFNPTFDNPMCGPQGECPSDHMCVQGVCRTMADQVDATIDSDIDSPVDAMPGDGLPGDGDIDGPPIDSPKVCQPASCGGVIYQCGNCVDDDADGLVDSYDPDCLGPCDNTEDAILLSGIPGQGGTCSLDLYFDQNTGPGDDGCRWDLRCYSDQPSGDCPYNPGLVGGSSCPNNQNAMCQDSSGPLTPNGCDCFGCCVTPDGSRAVWIGAIDAGGQGTCSFANIDDPTFCPTCQVNPSCFNDCSGCDVCVGRPLPAACGGLQTCNGGTQRCGQPGQAQCPQGEYCITGCCQPTPQ